MAQYNPFKASFENVKNYNKYAKYSVFISTIIIIIVFLLKNYDEDIRFKEVSNFISNLSLIFAALFNIFTFLSEYLFYDSSIHRRADFIDNSFNSFHSQDRSQQYYTNDEIGNGLFKMAVNGFENTFFTYSIAKKMENNKWVDSITFSSIIVILAIYNFNNIIVLFFQLTLPVLLLSQAINHTLFVRRIKRVEEKYRTFFFNLKKTKNIRKKESEIILNILDYETTITFGVILLDEKIYNKMNPSLSEKWEKIKIDYQITEK